MFVACSFIGLEAFTDDGQVGRQGFKVLYLIIYNLPDLERLVRVKVLYELKLKQTKNRPRGKGKTT